MAADESGTDSAAPYPPPASPPLRAGPRCGRDRVVAARAPDEVPGRPPFARDNLTVKTAVTGRS